MSFLILARDSIDLKLDVTTVMRLVLGRAFVLTVLVIFAGMFYVCGIDYVLTTSKYT